MDVGKKAMRATYRDVSIIRPRTVRWRLLAESLGCRLLRLLLPKPLNPNQLPPVPDIADTRSYFESLLEQAMKPGRQRGV